MWKILLGAAQVVEALGAIRPASLSPFRLDSVAVNRNSGWLGVRVGRALAKVSSNFCPLDYLLAGELGHLNPSFILSSSQGGNISTLLASYGCWEDSHAKWKHLGAIHLFYIVMFWKCLYLWRLTSEVAHPSQEMVRKASLLWGLWFEGDGTQPFTMLTRLGELTFVFGLENG